VNSFFGRIELNNDGCLLLAISETFMFPAAVKVMALGGLATGSINENDVAIVAGNIKYSGWMSISIDCKPKNKMLNIKQLIKLWLLTKQNT
jgi:hypothetical protein